MPADEMTDRIVRALSNPWVTFLGHVSGRKLLIRDGYTVEYARIFDAAAENGVLIDAERPDQLQQEILRFAADPHLRRRFGEAGNQIGQSFTADVMCRKYLALYLRAVAQRALRVGE